MGLHATVFDRLDALPKPVTAKWAQARDLSFDQTPEWFRLLYNHVLIQDFEPRIIVVSSPGEEALGVVPLALTKEPIFPFGIRKLQSLSNYYTSMFDAISLRNGADTLVAHELADCLTEMGGEADVVQLEPIAHNERFFRETGAALVRRGYVLAPYRRFSNWSHDVDGQSFEQYLQSRNGALRNTYFRKEKKLRKEGYELEIVRRPSELATALSEYRAVYEQSWKIPESHPQFIEAICRAFAEHDWLRLGLLRSGGAPIAAQIWFVKDGVASIFKLAYDERFKALSAGTILSMALFRHAIDVDQVAKVDYLTGDDAYKVQYMSRCREMWCLKAYRKASLAGLFGLYESSKSKARRWLGRQGPREVAVT